MPEGALFCGYCGVELEPEEEEIDPAEFAEDPVPF